MIRQGEYNIGDYTADDLKDFSLNDISTMVSINISRSNFVLAKEWLDYYYGRKAGKSE